MFSPGVAHQVREKLEKIDLGSETRRIDASGFIVAPGFIDLQINGAFGDDFTHDPETIWPVASGLLRYGVTSFLPTIITSPLKVFAAGQRVVTQDPPVGFLGAFPLGLHIEGPFLNPERKGAHNATYLQPANLEAYADLSPQTGVRLVTLAPELPGAMDIAADLIERGVVVSAGHSMASYEQATTAFDIGVRYGTHIFNAMSPFHQFEPGLVGALLSDGRPRVGLIADGIHVHAALVGLIWQLTGPKRLTLVTDAMAALGMPPGVYRIGDFEVHVDETSARLENGILAGSILSLDVALRNLISMASCSLEDALPTITSTPAELLGLDDHIGKIAAGYQADLTFLSLDLEVVMTMVKGEIVYRQETYTYMFN